MHESNEKVIGIERKEDENFGNFGRFNQLASFSFGVESDDSVSCECEFVCVVAVPLFYRIVKVSFEKKNTQLIRTHKMPSKTSVWSFAKETQNCV